MAKKTFKENIAEAAQPAAMRFISQPEAEHAPLPEKKETRRQRLNLLIKPSTAEALHKIAFVKKATVNGIINELAEQFIRENADTLAKYEQIKEIAKW